MGLLDRLIGDPSKLSGSARRRVLRVGSPRARIRTTLELARDGDVEPLGGLLGDPVPGVRRAAARGLGWTADPRWVDALRGALEREASDSVMAALGGAAIRCGAPVDAVLGLIRRKAAGAVATVDGLRRPGLVTKSGPKEAEHALWAELGRAGPGPARARSAVIAEGMKRLLADPDGPFAANELPGLACQAPRELVEALPRLEKDTGRRSEHVYLEALGWMGDPAALPRLREALLATDLDPGRAFAHRRTAAVALGRLGDPSLFPELAEALTREALEFEGRPGAGLGVQFPVRVALLWAVGEVGAPESAPLLAGYLENTHGSALGGFHIPAMAALLKLGTAGREAATRALSGTEIAAKNARGVLAGIVLPDAVDGEPVAVEADPRAIEGLRMFLDRRWFEAHEELEIAWRVASGPRKTWLQAMIQSAVALEHLRRKNPRGCAGQWTKARAKLVGLPADCGGVDNAAWMAAMDAFAEQIELEARSRAQMAGEAGPAGEVPPEAEWPRLTISEVLRGRIQGG